MSENFAELIERAKSLSGLSPEMESCLKEIAPVVVPHLQKVTDSFYVRLVTSPVTSEFLLRYEDRLDELKNTHLNWLLSLFSDDINADFAQKTVKIGEAHVAINLPLDFMTGAMSMINKGLIQIIVAELAHDKEKTIKALQAVNAVTTLVLVIMQKSYQLFD